VYEQIVGLSGATLIFH